MVSRGYWAEQPNRVGRSSPNCVPAPYFNEGRPLWGSAAYTLYTVSVSPQCPQEIGLPTLPRMVFQGAAISSEHTSQFLPPGNAAELRCSPPLRGSLEQLVRLSPAGVPFQDTKLAALITPEASLQRLVPLVGTWRCGSPCQACLIGSCLAGFGFTSLVFLGDDAGLRTVASIGHFG